MFFRKKRMTTSDDMPDIFEVILRDEGLSFLTLIHITIEALALS